MATVIRSMAKTTTIKITTYNTTVKIMKSAAVTINYINYYVDDTHDNKKF